MTVTFGELVQDGFDDGSRGGVVKRVTQNGISVAGEDSLHDKGKWLPLWMSRESS